MPDVFVVGGGVAGLSAAVAMAQAGLRVELLEARARLGGRTTSFVERATGERVDNGQHVILGCYRSTLRYLETIGARDHLRLQPTLRVPFIDRAGRHTCLRCPRWPSPFHLLAGVLAWPALSIGERLSVLKLAGVLRRASRIVSEAEPEASGADVTRAEAAVARERELIAALVEGDETVADWLRRHGQSDSLVEMLWEPLALAALNQRIHSATARPFVRVLGGIFGRDPGDAAVGVPGAPLEEVFGLPAERYLDAHGSSVRRNALARVVVEGGAVSGIEVRGAREPAAAVVAAVPWGDLPSLFVGDADPLESIVEGARSMASAPIVTVNLWFDRPVTQHEFVGLPGRPLQWVFDKNAAFGGSTAHLSLVASGADAVLRSSNEQLVDQAVTEMREAFPLARDAAVRQATVVREPNATFSLAAGQPARPSTMTPVRGLFLAGDWIDTGLPATIESAVISGQRAAHAAIALLSREREATTEPRQ